jgi:hypothetical protein
MNRATEHRSGDGGDHFSSAELLREAKALRDRTAAVARAYWLPLLLFGAVIGGSVGFYERLPRSQARARGATAPPVSCKPLVVNHPCHSAPGYHMTHVGALGYYWQIAIPVAVVLTVWWYRWRGNRVGLRTPSREFLIIGLVLSELVLLVPILVSQSSPGLIRDMHRVGPVVIIAALLWVLAWAERSPALAAITGAYLVAALAVAIPTNGGISGASTGAVHISLASTRLLGLLPAAILVVAGGLTWLIQQMRLRSGSS